MRFIADDGKIFDTAEECREYEEKEDNKVKTDENSGKEIAELWDNYICTYNSEGHEIKPRYNQENFKDYLNDVEDILESASFIIICCTDEEWEKISKYLRVKYNICCLPSYHGPRLMPLGLWRYDTFTADWIKFSEEYENFKATWAPMNVQIIVS